MARSRSLLSIVVLVVVVAVLAAANALKTTRPSSGPSPSPPATACRGSAACYTDPVAYIVDGDTLDVGNTRIRLALVNTPEVGDPGYSEAKQFTAQTYPVGSQALVDQDDGQISGSYGRMVAVVYCGATNLNAALLNSGNGVLVTSFCGVSEFTSDAWTGCP